MKRLDVNDPAVFDQWRERYWELTNEEQIQFADDLAAKYPDQRHFNEAVLQPVIFAEQPERVLEIGGWDGALAEHCLDRDPHIAKWVNVDICREASTKARYIGSGRQHAVLYNDFRWFRYQKAKTYDLAVAAHVIEHLHDADFVRLVECLSETPLVLFEAPINEGPSDWTGYQGTHILRVGWREIRQVMRHFGYQAEQKTATIWLFRKGG